MSLKTGYYVESCNRALDPEQYTTTHPGPKTLKEAKETFDFLNERLGDRHKLRIVFANVTTIRTNDA